MQSSCISISPAVKDSFCCFSQLHQLVVSFFFLSSAVLIVLQYFLIVFICNSLMICDTEHIFTCLFTIFIGQVGFLFRYKAISNGAVCSIVVGIIWVQILYHVSVLKIFFFPFVACHGIFGSIWVFRLSGFIRPVRWAQGLNWKVWVVEACTLTSWPAGRAKSTSLNFEVPACSSKGLDSMQLIGAWLSQDSPGLWLPDSAWLS